MTSPDIKQADLRKQVAFAISDPGHAGEGYKGDRTLTEWQTDAVMRVVEAAILAERHRHQWQDMSSAPKDGTNILVWAAGYELPEIVRYELYNDPELEDEAGELGFWRFAEDVLADLDMVEIEAFPHWMPLPSPPIKIGED